MAQRAAIELPYDRIENFCRKWKICELSLFGSVLTEEFGPESDIDVLVSFSPQAKHRLFDLTSMENELKEILGHNVDLAEKKAVEQSENYIRRRHILGSAKVIYVEG